MNTPRTTALIDKLNSEFPHGYPVGNLIKLSRELESELTTLRANLEALAEKWDGDNAIYIYKQCACELNRVLSGETPPAPGVEWKVKA